MDFENNKLDLFLPFQDTVIYERLADHAQYKDATLEHLKEFATNGIVFFFFICLCSFCYDHHHYFVNNM